MRSRVPKVLHLIGGLPMLDHVVEACRQGGIDDLVVVTSPQQPEVAAHLEGQVDLVYQDVARGTGHALGQVPPSRLQCREVVVVNGDQPLLRGRTIAALLEAHRRQPAAATLTIVRDPTRPDGRVLRSPDGAFLRIVEHRDATSEERKCADINAGLYCFSGSELSEALQKLRPDNAQGEYYLTDVFGWLRPVEVLNLEDTDEGLGINDRAQLARAESVLNRRRLEELMKAGVTVVDPGATWVECGVEIGPDTVLEPGTMLRRGTVVGTGCRIGPEAEVAAASIGDGVHVAHSRILSSPLPNLPREGEGIAGEVARRAGGGY
jgi:bifunctional UDP-N-acetylglucosamine pyrophosphorylase / glucosamine-1-phosphate N-acetyltransferase